MRGVRSLGARASAVLLALVGVRSATSHAAGASAPVPAGCTAVKTIVTCPFDYTGIAQAFTVPTGIRAVTIDAWGAQGGGIGNSGGRGGHDAGTVAVTPGAVLSVFVGGMPPDIATSGGFNGGGSSEYSGNPLGGPGGGASDVRRAPGALSDRIVVGGGGGGGGFAVFEGSGTDGFGGGAGDAAGPSSDPACTDPGVNICGAPGTAIAGGGAGDVSGCSSVIVAPTVGGSGSGGKGAACDVQNSSLHASYPGGGGGGGYFGGGGGGAGPSGDTGVALFGGGGGGSGFVDPHAVNAVHEAGVQSGNGKVTIAYSTKQPLPVQGTINCSVSGTVTFKPPLTNTSSTKVVKASVVLSGSSCDTSGVVGGKAPITDVAAKTTINFAVGADCSTISFAPKQSTKTPIKWQARNTKGKLFTVATENTTWNGAALSPTAFDVSLAAAVKGPFANETGDFTLIVDPTTFDNGCSSTTGLGSLPVNGTIVVPGP
jgi:hypothetical protein